jgi:hypothetical protein
LERGREDNGRRSKDQRPADNRMANDEGSPAVMMADCAASRP